MSASQDARHVPLSRAQRLAQDAAEAAEVRAYAEHPDVVALRVERVRRQVDWLMWTGILLGLAFTMVNVQQFAASGAGPWSLTWIAAWLLDPMVSVVLIAVLRAEQITARYQVDTGPWIRRTKWFAFLATYVMNTWQSWGGLHAAGIVLHSVPPLLVYLASEAAPMLRDRLTEAVHRAARAHATGAANTGPAPAVESPASGAAPTGSAAGNGPAHTAPAKPKPRPRTPATARTKGQAKPSGRKLLADFVTEARAAWAPGIEVTPAWVRQVTDCARGTSKSVADALNAELAVDSQATTVLPATGEHDTAQAERRAA
ncbi:hypothetical protein [Haloechinothrix aidingensis]|uniref:hypothetical protein n=1 Tax=Haloechinothrix aidingensis TaxID=2752311 RepID=UPI001FE6B1B7|nr:hypothetical protein [Haloechinothrix aidingensis]